MLANLPVTKVELVVECRNLRDRDVMSKSDPMCVLFLQDSSKEMGGYMEVGRTERLHNTQNPIWTKRLPVDYYFEQRQMLHFEIYDSDDSSQELKHHDFLGMMKCSLGEVVARQGKEFQRPLMSRDGISDYGTISVYAEQLAGIQEVVNFKFSAKNLDKKDVLSKSDPFMVISRRNKDEDLTAVHRTEVIKNTLNPSWRPFEISVSTLCYGEKNRSINFGIFDWDSDGSHDLIGEFTTNLNSLLEGQVSFECIHPVKKEKKQKYKNSGIVVLESAKLEQKATFLDYIQGGTQMNFTVAVDFTGSNGDPSHPDSLHYLDPSGHPNQYVIAIRAVGEVIQDYDTDHFFPALGFGAKIPPDWEVKHDFFLNLSPDNPYCLGVEGVLKAYSHSLSTVQLYGPTLFAPVIHHVGYFAAAHQDGQHYFVLLIITDGIICDIEDTKEAIVRVSSLPMSIIIVGVGSEDFSAMNLLDADEKRLKAGGKYAERDIVQFVEMRKYVGGKTWQTAQFQLARDVLAEVPKQLVEYMKMKGFKPNQMAGKVQEG